MKKILTTLAIVACGFFSAWSLADTTVSATGYGTTYTEASVSAKNQLLGQYPTAQNVYVAGCTNPPVGAPWQCTAYGTISTSASSSSCQVTSITGYGTSQVSAYEATMSQWYSSYSTEPGINCQPSPVGPPWQCTATGCKD
ncbi:hypothetical protein [Microbulbifer sp. SAOS-129_SWC]|uniref:hypothetical protein n=1 Tax=Microbulbifer sp. SAOS-129_SWC TaxID=3145235 RepID=UPI003216592F